MQRRHAPVKPVYLGIEAGATRTIVRAEPVGGKSSGPVELEFGPGNLRLLTDRQLVVHLKAIAAAVPQPAALAIGMAGARTDQDRTRIREAAARVWPAVPCYATSDLETALMAADDSDRGRQRTGRKGPIPRVLVLCGTGSCCYGQSSDGKTAKVGGWGHLLGDKGSAYDIGLRALKAVVYYRDRDGEWSELGQRILRRLMLNEPDDLIRWVQHAGKDEVAGVAVEVFAAWNKRDLIARDVIRGAAHTLAHDAAACARRLESGRRAVQFVFAGGVLLKQPRFFRLVQRELSALWPRGIVTPLRRAGVEGAIELAKRHFPAERLREKHPLRPISTGPLSIQPVISNANTIEDPNRIAQSPTEQRHPRSRALDRMSTRAIIELMLSEDVMVPKAVRAERASIERAVQLVVRSFRRQGRLFYVGAGTSGRLGVLDASECPPTFRTNPDLVQGIIAGGQTALWSAVEGAEDDRDAGARAIVGRGISSRDTVVGIAASGRTPFVWGALAEAKKRGARTVLLCFNPNLRIPAAQRPSVVIAPRIGPEILTGSTRLKAGTATKLVLNMLTTIAMVRLGKVLGNLMIDVKASNVKLRDRAVRIVVELTTATTAEARTALERNRWAIKEACGWLRRMQRGGAAFKGRARSSRPTPAFPKNASGRLRRSAGTNKT